MDLKYLIDSTLYLGTSNINVHFESKKQPISVVSNNN